MKRSETACSVAEGEPDRAPLGRTGEQTITGDPDGQNGFVTYGLDAVGNRQQRLSTVGLLNDQSFTFNARDCSPCAQRAPARLTPCGAAPVVRPSSRISASWLDRDTYDANGNTLNSSLINQNSSFSDEYDFKNRLIQRTEASGRTITFLHDADGTRIGKRVDPNDGGVTAARTTFFLNDALNPTGYSQVLEDGAQKRGDGTFGGCVRRTPPLGALWASEAQLEGGGIELSDLSATLTLNRVYTLGLDLIGYDARDAVDQWHARSYGYDGHGSIRELFDEAGTVLETYTYDAFGVQLSVPPDWNLPTANCYLYTGERLDSDLGLYYLRARYLNPGTGRFHNMDTYEGNPADPMTLHKYHYTHHDPVNGIDPSGMWTLSEIALVGTGTATLSNLAIAIGYFSSSSDSKWKKCFNSKISNVLNRIIAYATPVLGFIASWPKFHPLPGADPATSLLREFSLTKLGRPLSFVPELLKRNRFNAFIDKFLGINSKLPKKFPATQAAINSVYIVGSAYLGYLAVSCL